ncbi:unnamed protein product [Absidia cylindrospora]
MRMTLACVRCRLKKVKCDFANPSCTRCTQAKAPCSYEGSSTQVDLFNIVKLNDIVGALQQRVQSLESTISDIHQTTQTATDQLTERNRPETTATIDDDQDGVTTVSRSTRNGKQHSHSHQWSLSLTSTGLRINTNVVSLPNLYDILLSGVSQLDLNQDTATRTTSHDGGGSLSSSTCTSPLPSSSTTNPELRTADKTTMVARKTPLWRSKYTSFPLYNTWWPTNASKEEEPSSVYLEQTHSTHHHRHDSLNNRKPPSTTPFILDEMIEIYNECFICLPDTGYEGTIGERYHQGRLDSFLANAIFAWSARHGAVFHNLYPGQDPNIVGECYFDAAKDLLKDRFMVPSLDTLHGLLVLYLYAIGRPSRSNDDNKPQQQQQQGAVESEAYIFLGLAIRMGLDLKLHREKGGFPWKSEDNIDGDDCGNMDMDADKTNIPEENDENSNNRRIQREHHRRYFWVLYFLETLCSLHCDRPFFLPSEDQITVAYPDVLDDNETGERRFRTEYMIKRFRITRIYRGIIQWTSQEKLLLSSVTGLDTRLCEWYKQLPSHLQYEQGDFLRRNWQSTSWREQSCVKLNFEYHFQRSQLYAVFLKRQYMDGDNKRTDVIDDDDDGNERDDDEGDNGMDGDECKNVSSTFEHKAKIVCINSAVMTAELMQCWSQLQQRWCHFSLESLMMAVNIFEMLLKDKDHVEQAVIHLTTILNLLQVSPIQHHPYVILVITRIQQLVDPTKTGVPGSSNDIIDSTFTTETSSMIGKPDEGQQQLQQQQQQQQYFQKPLENIHQHINPNHDTCHYQPPLLQQQQQRPVDFYNAFRMPKSDGMVGASLSDLPFSDFLYNPVMEISSPFGTYTTTTTQGTFHQQQTPPSMTTLSAIPLPSAGVGGASSVARASSSSSSSLTSSSVSPPPPRKGTTTTPLISYPQDILPPQQQQQQQQHQQQQQDEDYPAATSLWTTLHQPTYASSELNSSLGYIPSPMPLQQQQQQSSNPYDTTNDHQHSNEHSYSMSRR